MILRGLVSVLFFTNCCCKSEFLRGEMASQVEALSLHNGFRCVPADGVMVEDVLVAAGEAVGHENISSHEQGCCGLFEITVSC